MDFGYNPWKYGAFREKSSSASRREEEAKNKFIYLKSQMDLALFENTMTIIGLGQRNKSKSPLKLLSSDTLEHVLAYAGIKPKGKRIKRIAKGRGEDLALRPFVGYTGTHFQSLKHKDETRLNLADMNVLQPGSKLTIPLTKPNLHLTGPCYRDLRKYVKAQANWDVKRIEATAEEKKKYRETRKGATYFINAIYKVPKASKRKRSTSTSAAAGGADKKKKKAKKAARKSPPEQLKAASEIEDSKPAAKKK